MNFNYMAFLTRQLMLYPNRFLGAYLSVRFIIWTLAIYLTQPTLPLDVLEHLAWGREWRVVYSSHPGLPAWIDEAVHIVFNGSPLALSAIAPFFSCLGMWAVWLLARDVIGDKVAAVVATLSLEGVFYFNVAAVEFNHNVAQTAAIALFFAAVWRAFERGGGWWGVVGAAAAFAAYAKYSSVLPLACVLAWSLWSTSARACYRQPGPYIAFMVFAVLMMPNIWALAEINFLPLDFAMERARQAVEWWQLAAFPAYFVLAQILACCVSLILCRLAVGRWRRGKQTLPPSINYVATITFAPLLLAVLISAVMMLRFKSAWGAAMCSFVPLWFVMSRGGPINVHLWLRGLLSVAALSLTAHLLIFSAAPFITGKAKRVHYPAQQIAAHLDEEWERRFPAHPLKFVIGDKHAATMVSYYSQWRPSAVINNDWQKTFWASPDELAKAGAVIVWMVDNGKKRQEQPPIFAKNYPSAWRGKNFQVAWLTAAELPLLEVGWMVVPPANEGEF